MWRALVELTEGLACRHAMSLASASDLITPASLASAVPGGLGSSASAAVTRCTAALPLAAETSAIDKCGAHSALFGGRSDRALVALTRRRIAMPLLSSRLRG